jgi:RNA recognition motif-containing protein
LIVDHIRGKLGFSKPEPEPVYEKKEYKKERKPEEGKTNDENNIELHVSNISLKASEDDLRKLFEDYGEIYRIKLLKRGTMLKAFIDLDTEKNAEKAIENLDGYEFLGQALEVRFSD